MNPLNRTSLFYGFCMIAELFARMSVCLKVLSLNCWGLPSSTPFLYRYMTLLFDANSIRFQYVFSPLSYLFLVRRKMFGWGWLPNISEESYIKYIKVNVCSNALVEILGNVEFVQIRISWNNGPWQSSWKLCKAL